MERPLAPTMVTVSNQVYRWRVGKLKFNMEILYASWKNYQHYLKGIAQIPKFTFNRWCLYDKFILVCHFAINCFFDQLIRQKVPYDTCQTCQSEQKLCYFPNLPNMVNIIFNICRIQRSSEHHEIQNKLEIRR